MFGKLFDFTRVLITSLKSLIEDFYWCPQAPNMGRLQWLTIGDWNCFWPMLLGGGDFTILSFFCILEKIGALAPLICIKWWGKAVAFSCLLLSKIAFILTELC